MSETRDPLKQVEHYAFDVLVNTEERDEAICRAREAGLSLRDIANAAGMSHQGIANILKKVSKDLTSDPPKGIMST